MFNESLEAVKTNNLRSLPLKSLSAAFALFFACAVHAAPPANDNFAGATVVTANTGTISGTNLEATKQANEPDHTGNIGGQSVWYRWVAPATGLYEFNTVGSDFDTLLAAYTGAPVGSLVEIASNDEAVEGGVSRVIFQATQGTTYRIAVDGWEDGAGFVEEGAITLNWASVQRPVNDDFSAATTLSGRSAVLATSNLAATKETGEPDHGGDTGGASIWYRWTAPENGTVLIAYDDTDGIAPLVGFYTGNSVGALTPVVLNEFVTGSFRCSVVAGTIYRLAFDGNGGEAGDIAATFGFTGANNEFSNPRVIVGASGSLADDIAAATAEIADVGLVPEITEDTATLWYQWTAPANGPVWFGADGGNFTGEIPEPMAVRVFTGGTRETLVHVPDTASDTAQIFTSVAGTTYRILVLSEFGEAGDFTLRWIQAGPATNDNIASATILSGNTGAGSATLIGATVESGEGLTNGSVWYRWTAPSAGVLAISTPSEAGIFTARGTTDLFANLASIRTVGLAAGERITFCLTADAHEVPTAAFSYAFTVGASIVEIETVAGDELLERDSPTATLTLRRETGAIANPATVVLAPTVGTGFASAGVHYAFTQSTVNFLAGETQKTVTLSVINNAIEEGPLLTQASIVAGANAVIGGNSTVNFVRYDDEDDPANNRIVSATVLAGSTGTLAATTLGADPDRATDPGYVESEAGGGALEFAVPETVWYQWTAATTGPIVFRAAQGTDSQLNITLAVFDGATAAAVVVAQANAEDGLGATVTAEAGWLAEADKTYYIAVAAADIQSNVPLGTPFDLSWQPPAAGFVSIADISATEGLNGTAVLTITRTNGTAAFDVDVETSSTGLALEDEDYTPVFTTVSFGIGELTKTVTVTILDDTLKETPDSGENGETFSVVISSGDPEVFIARSDAKVTILDDETGALVSLAPFGTDNETAQEDAGAFQITVNRGGITTGAASVDYTLTAGSATLADVNLSGGTVSFAAGETSKVITIPIIDDFLDEPVETFALTLSNPGANTTLGERTSAVLSIVDEDVPGVLAFSAATASATEPAGTVNLTVARTDGSDGDVSATFTIIAGSATAGADYSTTTGTVTLLNGETSKTIAIVLLDDFVDEADETFTVTLSSPTAGATLGAQRSATVTLADNDEPGVLAFSAAVVPTPESAGTVQLTVTRTSGSDGAVSVNFFTTAGTAVAGVHYATSTGTVQFAHGETTKNITIPLIDNSFDDADRQFTVTLRNPTAGATLGTQSSASVVISDNDTFAPEKTAFSALLKKDGIARGSVAVTTTTKSTVTVKALVGATKYTFSGALGADGSATLVFQPKGRSAKTLSLQVGGDAIRGTLNDGDGNIYVFNGSENDTGTKAAPVDVAAKYTALIQNHAAPNNGLLKGRFPQGYGWIQFAVGVDGKTKANGKLSDGTALTFGGVVDISGELPVFVTLYAAKAGAITFTLKFDAAQPATDATAAGVRWVKPAAPKDKLYPLGWPLGIDADLSASKFFAPAQPTAKNPNPPYITGTHNLLGLTAPSQVTVAITDGGTPGLSNDASVDVKSKVAVGGATTGATAATTLAVALKNNGSLSGGFAHVPTQSGGKLSGVVLQKAHTAGGFFIGTNASGGAVWIEP